MTSRRTDMTSRRAHMTSLVRKEVENRSFCAVFASWVNFAQSDRLGSGRFFVEHSIVHNMSCRSPGSEQAVTRYARFSKGCKSRDWLVLGHVTVLRPRKYEIRILRLNYPPPPPPPATSIQTRIVGGVNLALLAPISREI
jgi:hypothetical protein